MLHLQLPLDEPGSFSQQLSLPTAPLQSAGDDDALASAFDALGMKDDKIENAQQVD